MKSYEVLPEGYEEILAIDLQKNKKLMLLVNGVAVVLAVIMYFIGSVQVPISALFDFSQGMGSYIARFAVLLVGTVLYMVLHELTHASQRDIIRTRSTGRFFASGFISFFDGRQPTCIIQFRLRQKFSPVESEISEAMG